MDRRIRLRYLARRVAGARVPGVMALANRLVCLRRCWRCWCCFLWVDRARRLEGGFEGRLGERVGERLDERVGVLDRRDREEGRLRVGLREGVREWRGLGLDLWWGRRWARRWARWSARVRVVVVGLRRGGGGIGTREVHQSITPMNKGCQSQ